jgi:type I restriction enzyme S subunit
MTNWKEYKLSDLMNVIGGGTPKTKISEYWGGAIPWLSVVDFGNTEKRVFDTEKKITELGLNNSSTKMLQKGQIIISARGTVGELAVLGWDMAFNQSCYGLNAKSEICTNDFLYYLMKCKILELKRNAHGAVFDTITRNTFETVSASIPDIDTQTAIAEILSSLDDKIELNNKINQELENLAQTLFKQWFIDFEFPNQNGDPYKSSGGEMVDSELGEIPKGWEVKSLDEISNITIGRTPPRKEHQWFSENPKDVKWISIRDMGNCSTYILNTSEYLTEEAVSKFNVPIIEKNTVIISFKLTVGRISISTERMLSNEAIAHLNFFDKNIYPEFIYLYLKQFDFDSLGSTSSIATAVNSKAIKALKFIYPNAQLLGSFQEQVSLIFKQILNTTKENQELTNLRDTLLPKLISGELEVSEVKEG